MGRLEGKVALVTGAGGGIGHSICERFLAEGASVTAVDIDEKSLTDAVASAGKDRALTMTGSVSEVEQVRDAIARTVKAFGRLNVLCNIAGGSTTADGPITEAPEEEFWRAIKLDLFGTFLVNKYGIPELIRDGGGSVINFSSMAAVQALPGRTCYTAAKGGITAMTRLIAAEYGKHDIRVNAIAPAVTLTPRIKARMDTSDRIKNMAPRHVLGFLEPIDIANMAVYLASDESRKVTGQTFSVDGGYSIT